VGGIPGLLKISRYSKVALTTSTRVCESAGVARKSRRHARSIESTAPGLDWRRRGFPE
jgi:hypothetical protein